MDRSVHYSGKVGQAAAGDVINKAPQYSNAVNVHIAPNASPASRSGQVLTSQQKDVLAKLVRDVVAKRKCDPLDVWRPLLARAGAKKAKEIPIEEYRHLEDFLRQQLAEPTPAALHRPVAEAANTPPPSVSSPELVQEKPAASMTEPLKPSHSRAPYWLAMCSMLIAIASGAAMIDTRTQLGQIAGRLVNGQQGCQYAGQPYSLGSVVSHASGPMRCELPDDEADGFARWTPSEPLRSKRTGR